MPTLPDSFAYAQLPPYPCGLGNKLLVWARAASFAHRHGLQAWTSPWFRFELRAFLRLGSRGSLRAYRSYFRREFELAPAQYAWASWRRRIEREASLAATSKPLPGTIYRFDAIPSYQDYFVGIRDDREFLKRRLGEMLAPVQAAALAQLPPPVIAMHVRRGDFRPLTGGESLKSTGLARTPLDYFVAMLRGLRSHAGAVVPAMIFSDGKDEELAMLLDEPGVTRAPSAADVVEMLLMSKARILVASAGSTFSYWAGFLSEGAVVLHPDDVCSPTRDASTRDRAFEGSVREPNEPRQWPAALIESATALGKAG